MAGPTWQLWTCRLVQFQELQVSQTGSFVYNTAHETVSDRGIFFPHVPDILGFLDSHGGYLNGEMEGGESGSVDFKFVEVGRIRAVFCRDYRGVRRKSTERCATLAKKICQMEGGVAVVPGGSLPSGWAVLIGYPWSHDVGRGRAGL